MKLCARPIDIHASETMAARLVTANNLWSLNVTSTLLLHAGSAFPHLVRLERTQWLRPCDG